MPKIYKGVGRRAGDPPPPILANLSLSLFSVLARQFLLLLNPPDKPSDRLSEAVFTDLSPPIYSKVCILLVFLGFVGWFR